jgi:hypothetical protein
MDTHIHFSLGLDELFILVNTPPGSMLYNRIRYWLSSLNSTDSCGMAMYRMFCFHCSAHFPGSFYQCLEEKTSLCAELSELPIIQHIWHFCLCLCAHLQALVI